MMCGANVAAWGGAVGVIAKGAASVLSRVTIIPQSYLLLNGASGGGIGEFFAMSFVFVLAELLSAMFMWRFPLSFKALSCLHILVSQSRIFLLPGGI